MSCLKARVQAWALLKNGQYETYYDYGVTTNFCWLEGSPQLWQDPNNRQTNATLAVQALRLFVQAGVQGEVNATLGTYTYV